MHPESQGKILEIASQLGKKTGMLLNFYYSLHHLFNVFDSKLSRNKSKLSRVQSLRQMVSLIFFAVGLAFVDCTASSDTIVVLKQVVDMGCCVVMANKKPLTSTMVRSSQVFHFIIIVEMGV